MVTKTSNKRTRFGKRCGFTFFSFSLYEHLTTQPRITQLFEIIFYFVYLKITLFLVKVSERGHPLKGVDRILGTSFG